MEDLSGLPKINSGSGKNTPSHDTPQKKIDLTLGQKTQLTLVFMHLWLIAWSLSLLDKTLKFWERHNAKRQDKMSKIAKNSVIIDIEPMEKDSE